jgi:hypothetical protein
MTTHALLFKNFRPISSEPVDTLTHIDISEDNFMRLETVPNISVSTYVRIYSASDPTSTSDINDVELSEGSL